MEAIKNRIRSQTKPMYRSSVVLEDQHYWYLQQERLAGEEREVRKGVINFKVVKTHVTPFKMDWEPRRIILWIISKDHLRQVGLPVLAVVNWAIRDLKTLVLRSILQATQGQTPRVTIARTRHALSETKSRGLISKVSQSSPRLKTPTSSSAHLLLIQIIKAS